MKQCGVANGDAELTLYEIQKSKSMNEGDEFEKLRRMLLQELIFDVK
jgi:hypothetical protein